MSLLTDSIPETSVVVTDFAICDQITMRWADVDVYGHVNNVIYYSLVDTAINEWLIRETGKDTREQDDVFVVAETSCRFRSEINFPGVVDIGLAREHLGSSSVIYRFGIFAQGDPVARAYGRYVHVNVDAQTRTPRPMPQHMRDVIYELPEAKVIT